MIYQMYVFMLSFFCIYFQKDECMKKIRELGSLPSDAFETYQNQSSKQVSDNVIYIQNCNSWNKDQNRDNKFDTKLEIINIVLTVIIFCRPVWILLGMDVTLNIKGDIYCSAFVLKGKVPSLYIYTKYQEMFFTFFNFPLFR